MPEEELNLFEFAAGNGTETGATSFSDREAQP
jgi:hypothetical protein